MRVINLLVVTCIIVCVNATWKNEDYFCVPGGMMMHKSCLHHVEAGSHIIDNDDGVFVNGERVERCEYKPIYNEDLGIGSRISGSRSLPADGWQTWTSYQHPNNSTFTTFNGNFTVPNAPSSFKRNEIVYIFTGLQNDNWIPNSGRAFGSPQDFEIIQPVLQYGGASANGGGEYWGVASWYVTVGSGAFWSTELKVNPGDSIYGVMEAKGPTTWFINSVLASGQNSSITITRPRLSNNPWAYCTLEVYNIAECINLPPSNSPSHFTNMILTDSNGPISPEWTSYTEDYLGGPSQNPCGADFTIIDPTAVDLVCQSAN